MIDTKGIDTRAVDTRDVVRHETQDMTDTSASGVAAHARSLALAAAFLEVLVYLSAAAGVIIGLIVTFATGVESDPGNQVHPDVLTGIGIIILVLVAAVLLWAVARALRLFAEYAAFQVGAASPRQRRASSGGGPRRRERRVRPSLQRRTDR